MEIKAVLYEYAAWIEIGYGDYSPQMPLDRVLACFYIPLAVVSVGNALGQIADIYIDAQVARANQKLLGKDLTLADLQKMDTSGDNKVDEYEFTCFMLRDCR